MYPALQALQKSGKYILAALSNTVPFAEDHPYANPPPEQDIRAVFDVFISSAHVGYVDFLFALGPSSGYAPSLLRQLK